MNKFDKTILALCHTEEQLIKFAKQHKIKMDRFNYNLDLYVEHFKNLRTPFFDSIAQTLLSIKEDCTDGLKIHIQQWVAYQLKEPFNAIDQACCAQDRVQLYKAVKSCLAQWRQSYRVYASLATLTQKRFGLLDDQLQDSNAFRYIPLLMDHFNLIFGAYRSHVTPLYDNLKDSIKEVSPVDATSVEPV